MYARGTSVGVDTLVEEIGVAKMTLYKHFPTKGQLIVACLEDIDQRYRTWLERNSEGLAGEERLLGVFTSLRSWFGTEAFRGCAFVNATVELADPDHPARDAVLAHKRRMREWVAAIAEESGFVDPEATAAQIVQLMEGAISTALIESDPRAADVARDMAAVILASAERVPSASAAGPNQGSTVSGSHAPTWLARSAS